jgi:hypothetical protein
MARKTPAGHLETIERILSAWESMQPHMRFCGMTLDQFKAAVQPSLDKRAAITHARAQLRTLIQERNAADRRSWKLIRGVVSSVMSTPEENEDGPLYAAMGYVPWSVRHGSGTRKRKARDPGRSGKPP